MDLPAPALAVADTHVHFYPCFDLPALLRGAARRLTRMAGAHPAGLTGLFLTERHDCRYFRELREGRRSIDGDSFHLQATQEEDSLIVRGSDGLSLYLIAGRQIISRERIEILALTRDLSLPDGAPAREVLSRIRADGAVPVLGWAPGKWFFERGRLVRRILEEARPGELLVGDTSLRPTAWATPLLLRLARRRGIRMIAGSDPLPFPGEERVAGQYATRIEGPIDPARPSASLRRLLLDPETRISLAGRRDGVVSVLRRLLKNHAVRRSDSR